MARDVKDVIGVLMRVIDGGEVSQDELADLGFDAEGEVQVVLNETYIRLLEFAHDRAARSADPAMDRFMRSHLEQYLARLVSACDRQSRAVGH